MTKILKFAITAAIVWAIGFVLFDAIDASVLTGLFAAGWALAQVPGRVWLALAEGFAEMAPYLFFGLLS